MVIKSIIQSNVLNSTIQLLPKTKEQIEQENYNNLETPKELFKRLGYLYPKKRKEYVLNNGLKIKNRRQTIKRNYKCEKILAFDTETYHGCCKLIACSGKKSKLNPSFLDCLKFLFYLADNPNIYRFFYNIDFDFSSILKLWKSSINVLKKRILRKIEWLKNGIEVKYKSYILMWIKGRMLSIKHITRRKSVVITDIFNFFREGLNKESEKYINDIKINDINGNLLNNSLDYWKKRQKDIIEYCIQDCILTKKLGIKLIDTINKINQPLPKYLVSSASLSKQYFRLNCYIPSISHIPKKILQISYDTYFGGRFEMFKRGWFNELFLYDIVSQYPSFIKRNPNLRNGVWKKSLYIPKKECFAYYLVKLNIPKEYKIPTIPIRHNGVNKFPNGIIKKWITWYDLDLIRDYIVKVYKGYRFLKASKSKTNPIDNSKPFEKAIDNLFKKKQIFKKETLEYNLTKLTMNAVYGCFIETHKNYDKEGNYELNSGIMFNSVYASQITAFGRWSVIKDIPKEYYNNIIAIHTDSIISDISLDKFLDIGKELSQWNLEVKGKGIILNTGMYQIGNLVKTRGIPKKFIKNWLRFSLKNQIYKKKMFEIPHMRKLSEGLIRDKSLINVNTIMDDKRSVNCNSNTKRDWISNFRSFKEVISKNIDSYPYYMYNNELEPNPLSIAYRFENK